MQPGETNRVENGMSPARRWSGLYTLGLIILLLIFFAYHQSKRTGFFTSSFGSAEMVALYIPIVISMLAPIIRLVQGRNEAARLVDAVSDVCLAIGSLWMWITFPLNFAHFADVLPSGIQFAFTWLNDSMGRIILILQIVIGLISAFSSAVSYTRERGKQGV